MYRIKNGILEKDGKRVIAIGESYYPSFNPTKFPVMPDADRIGEMKKDLRMMAEAGFNHVRFAALGEVGLDSYGEISVDTPFIDAMVEESEKNDISVSIREQGFAVNLRGFENVDMIDEDGEPQETAWSDFIRTTMSHEGILEDNRTYAEGLARHYAEFPTVVGFQIFNEPHYPMKSGKFYDYHPTQIAAYRKWLVEGGYMTESEAESYEPPRKRSEKTPREWALWRLFSRDALTRFLDNAQDGSKSGSPLPTFTCFTQGTIARYSAYAGLDLFANAKSMDIVGYTTYRRAVGADYPVFCLETDMAQCAAELLEKESWCIELDSRTYIPSHIYNRNTYTLLGAGAKGIVYYQWRGDCPMPGVPYPNSCGILNYDGTKTANFDNAVRMNRFTASISDLLVNAHRLHEGVAILHSDYAAYYTDACENAGVTDFKSPELASSYNTVLCETYRGLLDFGYAPDVVTAEALSENKFGIKVLYVPKISALSPEELEAVRAFRKEGGRVFENTYSASYTSAIGYKEFDEIERRYEDSVYIVARTVPDVADLTGIYPTVSPVTRGIGTRMLEGNGCNLLFLVNTRVDRATVDATVELNIPSTSVECLAADGDKELVINGNTVTVKGMTDGALLIIR